MEVEGESHRNVSTGVSVARRGKASIFLECYGAFRSIPNKQMNDTSVSLTLLPNCQLKT